MVQEGRPNLISNESCVGIALQLTDTVETVQKRLGASVFTCEFQIQRVVLQTDELHSQASEYLLGVKRRAGMTVAARMTSALRFGLAVRR